MKGLKSICFNVVSITVIAAAQIACSSGSKKESKGQTSTVVDTLNYEKKDYDSMRIYFKADAIFMSALNIGVEDGHLNATKMKKLLATEYESRYETGMTESEIDAVIYYYYYWKKIGKRFEEIESKLPKGDSSLDAIQKRTDSVINIIKKMKEEMAETTKQPE